MSDFVKRLKEQINIVDVVGEYVRLRKSGSNHMGLCPFHAERSPSFSVVEKKGIYHCFGCQRGGDAISFVQEIQGVSFVEAVQMLSQKYGVKLPPEFASRTSDAKGGAVRSQEDALEIYYKLNRFVAQFYHEKLLSAEGRVAREYLAQRGISDQTIKTAYLGYAPSAWSELYDFLAAKKAPLDKAEELGLIRRKSTGADADGRAHYDLFRDRVMFPVTDLRGRVIAFGGRAIGDGDGPKYLNSTESPVYKKGNNLFGIFFAQKEIRAEDYCVIVEGFMDCLALQQAGLGYTVATLGTALTEKQVSMLKRFTKNICVLFDGDAAGQEAQSRSLETFLAQDIVVRGVSLPDEFDPDEFVRERGATELEKLVKSATFVLDQKILELVTRAGGQAESRASAVDQILPWVAKISSDTARLMRIQEVSSLFDVKAELLERRVTELRSNLPKVSSKSEANPGGAIWRNPQKNPQGTRTDSLDPLDARMIELLLLYPLLFNLELDVESILRGVDTEFSRAVIAKLFANAEMGADEILALTQDPVLLAQLRRALVRAESVGETAEVRVAALNAEQTQDLIKELKDLEQRFLRRGLERRRDQLRAIIRKTDGSGQTEELQRLMSEYHDLVRRLNGGQLSL